MASRRLKSRVIKTIKKIPAVKSYLDDKIKLEDEVRHLQNEVERLKQEMPPELEKIPKNKEPKIKFIAHRLDNSGAPHIFIDLAIKFKKHYPKAPVEFHTFLEADKDNVKRLAKAGLEASIHKSFDIKFNFTKGDVVLLNTLNIPYKLAVEALTAAKEGIVNKVIWYSHEDKPSAWVSEKGELKLVKEALHSGILSYYVPSFKARQNFMDYFKTDKIKLQPYRISIPAKYRRQQSAADFNRIKFILNGIPWNERKGHLPVLYAFLAFKRWYYDKSPQTYRPFELHYVGLIDNLASQQIKQSATSLGTHFVGHPTLPHPKALELTKQASITICYSLSESLPIFVLEGLAAGHPLIRNDVSGMEEQLNEGVNGFYVDKLDYNQLVDTIEKILNKSKTSNQKLANMSKASSKIADKQAAVNYDKMLNEVWSSFH